jgi:DNA-binding transcriptional regulator YiaG
MMTLHKYEVVTKIGCDEFCDYAGQDIKEALRVARQFKDQNAELRTNIDEVDGGLNYDTVAYRFFVSIAETGDQLEECDSLAEAEKRIREMEDDDRLEGNYTPDYYAVTDEDGQSYRADLDDMTEEQAAADANCIRRMREQTGLNRKQFCDKYGIPYRTMQDWEDGKSKPVEWAERLLRRAVRDDFPG